MIFPVIIQGVKFFVAQKMPSGMICRRADTHELVLFACTSVPIKQVQADMVKTLWGQPIDELVTYAR